MTPTVASASTYEFEGNESVIQKFDSIDDKYIVMTDEHLMLIDRMHW